MCCTSGKNISLYERDATLLNLVKLWLGLFFKELRCQKSISELRNGEGCRDPAKQFCMSCLWNWKHDSLPQVMVCVNLSPSLKLVLLQRYYSDLRYQFRNVLCLKGGSCTVMSYHHYLLFSGQCLQMSL